MLDLSKIKEIKISEGSVKKITDSSGVVLWQKVVTPSSSLDVDLNNQWIVSTKKLDGYNVYMSNSNHNVDNGYASMKFKFKGMPDFKIWINSYAESSYDYTVAWNMDKDYPTSNPSNGSTGVKAHTNGKQYNPNSITAFTEVDYPNDGGEHFVVVTYRKDSSANANDDRGYVAIKLTLISTTWVVSSTEFVKKDNKYYQRINEVNTYEGGVTALTGNYKEGNELTVTYKQGSADDYMIVGSSMYYKKYAYVTPVNTEINTGDYIQGDYIGEAIPAMKVTYKDGSNKTFYNLTSIEENTDANKANAKSVEVYDGVTSIGDSAFYHCSSLTSVTISDSVTSIGKYAFNSCTSLATVTIQNSTSKISFQDYAFTNIPKTAQLYVPRNLLDKYKYDSNWHAAFKGGIYNIPIPAMKVTYVDGTEKTFNNLTTIDKNTDSNIKNAKEVEIYDSVKEIGNYAFDSCTGLTRVTIPNSVTTIGSYVFQGCSVLTSVTIPDSVTKIDYAMCSGCTSLTSVTIPDSVTSIGIYAFRFCTSLATVTIQNSTTKLAYNTDAFADISSSAKLYVPSNLLADYQSDSNWTNAFGGGIFAIPS